MKVKVGLVQDSPVFFDKPKTLDKIEALTKKYVQEGCELLVFPESFIPGYPRGFDFGAKVGSRTDEGRELYATYRKHSFSLEGPELKRLEKLARTQNVYLVIGVTEKREEHGSLFCSMLYISPSDGLLAVHRKIKPTGTERIVWAEAGAASMVTCDTRIGKLGGLICWENYMPLARMAMYRKGVELYIAPTADSRDEWTSTMQHIALEGRCFVLGCNQYYTKSMYPKAYRSLAASDPEDFCPGGSVIVSPLGKIIAGPLSGKAGLVAAELDLDEISKSKLDFDVTGHYARNDLFQYDLPNQPAMVVEKKKK